MTLPSLIVMATKIVMATNEDWMKTRGYPRRHTSARLSSRPVARIVATGRPMDEPAASGHTTMAKPSAKASAAPLRQLG